MVWGMRLPIDFGQFWPSGEFEHDAKENDSGWYDRLRNHYYAQTPEEQIRLYDYRKLEDGRNTVADGANDYRTYVSSKFRIETGKRDPGLHHLPVTPVEAHEVPQTFDTDKSYKSLGSMIKLNDRILAVDKGLKAIIEQLEPDVHQFFPFEITMPRGKIFPENYYFLVIRQYYDSYQPEKSDPGKKNFSGLVFSKDAYGDAHLWKDRGTPALTYFSDELKVQIDKAGLKIPKHYKMNEVNNNSDAHDARKVA